MLTTFRIDLPGAFTPEGMRGREEVGAGVDGVEYAADGARRPLLGVLVADREGVASAPVLFLVFGTGRAGRAMLGGPLEDRDGLGRVVAIVNVDQ